MALEEALINSFLYLQLGCVFSSSTFFSFFCSLRCGRQRRLVCKHRKEVKRDPAPSLFSPEGVLSMLERKGPVLFDRLPMIRYAASRKRWPFQNRTILNVEHSEFPFTRLPAFLAFKNVFNWGV